MIVLSYSMGISQMRATSIDRAEPSRIKLVRLHVLVPRDRSSGFDRRDVRSTIGRLILLLLTVTSIKRIIAAHRNVPDNHQSGYGTVRKNRKLLRQL